MIHASEILKAAILIVDDEEANVILLEEMLSDAGYVSIASTRDPHEVCELHSKNHYALILLDVQMPGMDGFQVMQALKAIETDGYLPVLVITAQPDHKLRALKAGAKDFVSKPFDLAEVLMRVQNMLEVRLLHLKTKALYDKIAVVLSASEQLLRLFRSGPVAMVTSTVAHGQIIDVNEQFCSFFGYLREEMIGRSVMDLKLWANPAERAPMLERLLKEGPLLEIEINMRRRSGEARVVLASMQLIELAGAGVSEPVLINMFTDITERKQAEESLRESEERFRQLAENIQEVFWMTNPAKTQILYISPAYETIWGRSCESLYATPGTWLDAIHPEDRERVINATGTKQLLGSYDEDYRVIRPNGSICWVRDRAFPIRNAHGDVCRIVGVAVDITEHKLVERQMLRTQRLESIGTLAGGVAHDINNALAPILMGVELLRMQYPDATGLIDTMETSAIRGADMVRQLLTFAKGIEGARLVVQPRRLVQEIQKIIKNTFPKNIELQITCPNELYTILADATQLHQVLLNLCVNARDAMPDGGTLTLEAANVDMDATFASGIPEAKPGHYVVWRVTDTGTGIPPDVLERIFEPFFSTKGPDKGTGLGLSTVMGIVKSHGGFIQIYSTLGQGSQFAVYLPSARGATGNTERFSKPDTTFRGRGEIILVVDDEPAVRQITREVLTALNFQVLTAADGADALIQVAEKRAELSAVITDLDMPYMGGLTFVRLLKHMLPKAGIIITSGRLEEREVNEFKTLGVSALLDKPFTQDQLVEALKNVFKK